MLLYKRVNFEIDHRWLVMDYDLWLFPGKEAEAAVQDSCVSWDADLVWSLRSN